MRVFENERRRSRPLPWLLLAFVVAVLAAGGFGFFERGFLQRLKADPQETLLDRPLRILRAREEAADLPVLRVDMKFKHYEKILARRQDALERGILQTGDNDMVPAEIEVDGRKVRVKMRLKGDWPDHFETEKWSYRVHVRGGDQIFGMRRFSLQHPASRRYLAEWAFLEHVRREGNLAPRYRFVRMVFNGDDKGIFALEEHFAKELLESQGRREGPILKFEEAPLWESRGRALDSGVLDFSVFDQLDYQSADVDFFGENGLRADSLLWGQAQVARARLEAYQRGELQPSLVFDVDAMARYLALCRLWGANHALIWHNLRFYYDPVSTLFEPIAFDGEPMDWTREEMWATDLMGGFELVAGHGGWYRWIEDLLQDPRIRQRYLEELYRLSREEPLTELRRSLGPDLQRYSRALRPEWLGLSDPFEAVERGRAYLVGRFEPAQALVCIATRTSDPGRIRLRLGNVAQLPVILSEVRDAGGATLWWPELELPGRTRHEAIAWSEQEWDLPHAMASSLLVTVSRIGGVAPPREERFVLRDRAGASPEAIPPAVSVDETFRRHPFLRRSGEREWTVPAGAHEVRSDLSLAEGWTLRVEAGAELRFHEQAVLVCRGPLLCEGSPEAPIRLTALYGSWPGVLVLESDRPSLLRHVEVSATRGVERPGWTVLGGVSFQESPVEFEHCRFLGHLGEDALNIVRSRFQMRDCAFEESFSDAFDGDFAQGSVERAVFRRIGGDALDFSGSKVDVEGMRAYEIADKAVSAGESSHLRIHDLEVHQASIGVAAKDLSTVELELGRIEDVDIGLAAYTKKPVYGPGFLEARELEIVNAEREVLVQEGSEVRWNLQLYEGGELDVKELYARGILGN